MNDQANFLFKFLKTVEDVFFKCKNKGFVFSQIIAGKVCFKTKYLFLKPRFLHAE